MATVEQSAPRLTRSPIRTASAASLVCVGVLFDVAAGLFTLQSNPALGVAIHLPACLTWGLGVLLLSPQPLAPRRTDSRALTMAVLGVVLFPGLGTVGCTIALSAAVFGRRGPSSSSEHALIDEATPVLSAHCASPATNCLLELEVEPLEDLLRSPDLQSKRAAMELLKLSRGYEALPALRRLLSDPDADVRTFAAVTVSGLENELGRELLLAAHGAEEHPQTADHHARLARIAHQYARTGPLDEDSRRIYLLQAQTHLQTVLDLEPGCGETWIELARINQELGETPAAWGAVNRALAEDPYSLEGGLLAMEMALEEGRFGCLPFLAGQTCEAPIEDLDTREFLEWWAGREEPTLTPAPRL